MTKIAIGVAGAGVFGSYHAAKIAALEGASLSGVYDIDPARAEALGERHGAPALRDIDDLIEASRAVVIAAPAVDHDAIAMAAIKAGRHVFVEKPLSTRIAGARRLVDAAGAADVILQVGHQERYVAEAVGLFSRQGAPRRIEAVRHTPFSGRGGDVSVALDLMVHDLDIARALTGASLERASATGDHDAIAAELVLSNGTLATFTANRRAPASERRITAIYDTGVVEFDFIRRTLKNGGDFAEIDAAGDPDRVLALADPLAYGAKLFLNGVRSGDARGVSGASALIALEWARAIEKSAGLGEAGEGTAEAMKT